MSKEQKSDSQAQSEESIEDRVAKLEEVGSGEILDYRVEDDTLVGTVWRPVSGDGAVIWSHDDDGELDEEVVRLDRYEGFELEEYLD